MNLADRIELLRRELNRLGTKKGLQDFQVIEISKKLDQLISEYHQVKSECKRAVS